MSRLVAHFQIFRRRMKGKFDAYVLGPLAKKFQNWIVDQSTTHDFMVNWKSVRSQSGVVWTSSTESRSKLSTGTSQELVRSLIVTKFGELIWKALQIWRADLNSSPNWYLVLSQISLAGFNVSLSKVCWESVRSQSGVCQKSVWSLKVTKFGELIWTALQIETLC